MSMWLHPSVPADQLRQLEEDALKNELQWYLRSLQPALALLKEGLDECVSLLAPREPGSTLVLSSLRSENIKGFVTRVGARIIKGDLQLRLSTLAPNTVRSPTNSNPSTRLSFRSAPTTPDLLIPQLTTVRTLLNGALDIIDISRFTGSATDQSFIAGQLQLLHENLDEARACLKGLPAGHDWTTDSVPVAISDPPLPNNLSLHFSIQDANLVLIVRTLAPASPGGTPQTPTESPFSLSGFGLRNRLLGLGPKLPVHDEAGAVFLWHDSQEVIVREKVRVESADPSLLSVAAKLSALEHEVSRWQFNLRVLTGDTEEG